MNWLIFVRTIAVLKIQSATKTHSNVSCDLLLLVSVQRGLQLEGYKQNKNSSAWRGFNPIWIRSNNQVFHEFCYQYSQELVPFSRSRFFPKGRGWQSCRQLSYMTWSKTKIRRICLKSNQIPKCQFLRNPIPLPRVLCHHIDNSKLSHSNWIHSSAVDRLDLPSFNTS